MLPAITLTINLHVNHTLGMAILTLPLAHIHTITTIV